MKTASKEPRKNTENPVKKQLERRKALERRGFRPERWIARRTLGVTLADVVSFSGCSRATRVTKRSSLFHDRKPGEGNSHFWPLPIAEFTGAPGPPQLVPDPGAAAIDTTVAPTRWQLGKLP